MKMEFWKISENLLGIGIFIGVVFTILLLVYVTIQHNKESAEEFDRLTKLYAMYMSKKVVVDPKTCECIEAPSEIEVKNQMELQYCKWYPVENSTIPVQACLIGNQVIPMWQINWTAVSQQFCKKSICEQFVNETDQLYVKFILERERR